MNICVVIPSFYPAVVYGGWVFSSINTCRELAKLGIRSLVSTTNDNGKSKLKSNTKDYIRLEENIYVKYYPQTIREKVSIQMLFNLWKDIRSSDVVHVQSIFSLPTPIALFYANLLNKKVLLSPHGCLGQWCLADGSRFKKQYLNLLIKPYAEKVLWHATSLQEKNEILALYPEAKVEIISNGIHLDEFKTINRFSKMDFIRKFTKLEINADKVIVSMSRIHKKKGIDILIKAFKIFSSKFPDSVLMIAGEDFGERQVLEKLIEDTGLNKKVFFIGHIAGQDRVDFFGNADIFVLPSHNENFGMVYAEAMAAGTSVVASTNTPWEQIENLGIGRWVKNDIALTAEAMESLYLKNLTQIGDEARKFVKEYYSWESIGIQFKKTFSNMISGALD